MKRRMPWYFWLNVGSAILGTITGGMRVWFHWQDGWLTLAISLFGALTAVKIARDVKQGKIPWNTPRKKIIPARSTIALAIVNFDGTCLDDGGSTSTKFYMLLSSGHSGGTMDKQEKRCYICNEPAKPAKGLYPALHRAVAQVAGHQPVEGEGTFFHGYINLNGRAEVVYFCSEECGWAWAKDPNKWKPCQAHGVLAAACQRCKN